MDKDAFKILNNLKKKKYKKLDCDKAAYSLDKLMDNYDKFCKDSNNYFDMDYEVAYKCAKIVDFDGPTLEGLVQFLPEKMRQQMEENKWNFLRSNDTKVSIYLNACINKVLETEPDFTLYTQDFSSLNHIGMNMKKGTLNIEGSITSSLGYRMEGGEINMKGKAGWFVGNLMSGGKINIDGDFKTISMNIKGGEININGRKIRY